MRQVRICIEVLRHYLGDRPLADPAKEQALTKAEKDCRLAVYTTLLSRFGTSYEEVRLAKTADASERKALAERLGIDSPNRLDELLLDPDGTKTLSEKELESLFGLVDTNRYPLSDGITEGDTQNQIKRWNLENVEWGTHTDGDGQIHVSLKQTAAGKFGVELYRSSVRETDDLFFLAPRDGLEPPTQ